MKEVSIRIIELVSTNTPIQLTLQRMKAAGFDEEKGHTIETDFVNKVLICRQEE